MDKLSSNEIIAKLIKNNTNAKFADDLFDAFGDMDIDAEIQNSAERYKNNNTKIVKAIKKTDLDTLLEENVSRTDILALGFVLGQSSSFKTVDMLLKALGYDALYPRDPYEASLIYAYELHLAIPQWHKLTNDIKNKIDGSIFPDGRHIKYRELKRFVEEYSEKNEYGDLITKEDTAMLLFPSLKKAIEKQDFNIYLEERIGLLKTYRFKSTYYLCKMIYDMIEYQIDKYMQLIEKHKQGIIVEKNKFKEIGSKIWLTGKVEENYFSDYDKNFSKLMSFNRKLFDEFEIKVERVYKSFSDFWNGADYIDIYSDNSDDYRYSAKILIKIIEGYRAITRSYLAAFAVFAGKNLEYISHILEKSGFEKLDVDNRSFDLFLSQCQIRNKEERIALIDEISDNMFQKNKKFSLYEIGLKGTKLPHKEIEALLK